MERLSRLVILVSILSAGIAHAFLVSHLVPTVPWIAAVLFAASFGLTRFSLQVSLLPALLLAYSMPALMLVVGGEIGARDPLAWLALLAGPIVASSDWSRWHTPRLWTPLLAMWALTIAVTWPIVAGREIDFSLVAAATLDTSNGLWAPPPPIAAAMVTGTALSQLLAILWLDLLWQRFGSDRLPRMERAILVPLACGIVVTSLAGIYQRYVDPNWLGFWVWPGLGRSASLMLDANSFGMAAALWAPLPLVLAYRLRRSLLAGAAICAVLLAGAWASGSRTGFVVTAAGVAGGFAASLAKSRTWRARVATVVVLLATAAIAGLASQRAAGVSPLRRLMDTLPPAEHRTVARVVGILSERDGYGVAAGRAIAQHPVAGVGIGSFNHLAGDYFRNTTGGLLGPDNAQNWWRQQVVELGFLGAAPSLALSLLTFLVVVSARAQERSGGASDALDSRPPALVLRAVLLGVGLISMLAVPTQQPAVLFTVVTVIFWLSALVSGSPFIAVGRMSSRTLWALVAIVPLIVASLQLKSARSDLRVPVRAERVGFLYAYGFTAADRNAFWMGRHAIGVVSKEQPFFSWTAEGPHLTEPVRVRLWRNQQLIADLEVSRDRPVKRIITVPSSAKLFSLEAAITGSLPDDRALRITPQWLPSVPPGTPAELIVP